MKKTIPNNESDLSNVSDGGFSAERLVLNINEDCANWKCNICSNGLKSNFFSSKTVPSCKHYLFVSCRNCQNYNAQSNACNVKLSTP